MKIVNIIGGLGNQLFQYAFAVALSKEFPAEEIKINTLGFRGYPLHNGFELDRLINITLPACSTRELMQYAYPWVHYRLWQIGHRTLPRRESMCWDDDYPGEFAYDTISKKNYFDGYWQSPKFFSKYRKDIIGIYRFKDFDDTDNLKALDFIKGGKTAFVHVRRGDYVKHPVFGGICDIEYYREAIQTLHKKRIDRFILFTNDKEWSRENVVPLFEDKSVLVGDWNKGSNSYKDMQLMTYCHAGIIANSSFSWWGAWLSGTNNIIAPSRWTNVPGLLEDIIPDEWTKIKI